MRYQTALATLLLLLHLPAAHGLSATDVAEPFKVGTFEIDGAPTVGIVLRDALVIDLAAANTALEIDPMDAANTNMRSN